MPAVRRPFPIKSIGTRTVQLDLDAEDKVVHLPDWTNLSHPERIKVIRQIAMARGRDPRIATTVVRILRKAGVNSREYVKQAAALLAWVQQNIYYVNEPGERLQDPLYTLKVGYGDCDDLVILLGAFFESIGMPWRLVLSGRHGNQKLRYIEGDVVPVGVEWVHIYLAIGTPSFKPTNWYFCEPTIRGVPLGWDVVGGDASFLPEMVKNTSKEVQLMTVGVAPAGFQAQPLPPPRHRSPAYAAASAYGGYEGSIAGGAVGAEMMESGADTNATWLKAIVTGVTISVTTALFLDWINGKGLWQGKGHVVERWSETAQPARQSVLVSPSPLLLGDE